MQELKREQRMAEATMQKFDQVLTAADAVTKVQPWCNHANKTPGGAEMDQLRKAAGEAMR